MTAAPLFFDGPAVRAALSHAAAIDVVRSAMEALSRGDTHQLPRGVIGLGPARDFGIMPAALGERDYFGAKLISVFPHADDPGRRAHRGVVILFEPEQGYPVCIADAEEITLIRTAAASAVATDVLARPDATRLTILGTGAQAAEHVRAIALVRPLSRVTIWGRSLASAQALAAALAEESSLHVSAEASAEQAVSDADIVCTLTGAVEPILLGRWVRAGTHLNLVGSSRPGAVEVDNELVLRSRFIADSRASVLVQGAEYLDAVAAGLITEDHVVGEIGEVLLGTLQGRTGRDEITVYKSVGHAIQDLAAAAHVYRAAASRPGAR